MAGLDRTYISGIERGLRNPTITVVAKCAKALGITSSSLLYFEFRSLNDFYQKTKEPK